MQTVNFSKTSWHYWMVKTFSSKPPKSDLCAYIRQFIGSIILAVALAVVASLVVAFVGGGIIAGFVLLFQLFSGSAVGISNVFLVVGGIFDIVLLLFSVFVFGGTAASVAWAEHREKAGPSNNFVVLAYRTIKDKVCFKINFK
jgi:hypothetical protein